MSVIDIQRSHDLGKEKARTAADALADNLARKLDVQSEWQGDRLMFRRSGVNGHLDVSDTELHVHLELGMMLRPFKQRIEEEIHTRLDRVTSA
ncbi:polyhydroxyalkanoic acid system family protein [Marinobacter oulmenensis]|uniref:Putative polyhydroxyalkanoate system protein n=1 Tax=Marinobacter oulmenensis TaxID=643747 RepID=A0A840UGF0_9GAMM|nr:polyhydroxyalkanoic acid system family protein [Marinobacter oulmenensis]MBB5319857.1 putative polyhydroxyalkanoate system protein [Marinobacter oulmenensis]